MNALRATIGFGVAMLVMAGCDGDDDGGPTVSGSSASVGMPTSGSDSAPASDTDATSGGGTTSGAPQDTSSTGPGTPDAFPECDEFAAWASSCPGTDSFEELLALCSDVVSASYADATECGDAYLAAFVCLTGLDCSAADLSEPPPECESQGQAVEASCNFADGTGSSGGTGG